MMRSQRLAAKGDRDFVRESGTTRRQFSRTSSSSSNNNNNNSDDNNNDQQYALLNYRILRNKEYDDE